MISHLRYASDTTALSLVFCKYKDLLAPMPKPSPAAKSAPRSTCPIACALDLLGDRWTLVIVRDLFLGKSRYGAFSESAEGIPTNILADRLARLETTGIITSAPYQENPPRYAYALTPKGHELKPVLGALAMWSMKHLPKTEPDKALLRMLRP